MVSTFPSYYDLPGVAQVFELSIYEYHYYILNYPPLKHGLKFGTMPFREVPKEICDPVFSCDLVYKLRRVKGVIYIGVLVIDSTYTFIIEGTIIGIVFCPNMMHRTFSKKKAIGTL